MNENDQPRPDLDAAVDAVLPSLTAVSDEAAAASLRRTRVGLADAAPVRGSLGPWRWAVPVGACAVAALAAFAWWPTAPAGDGPRVVVNAPAPAPSPRPPTPSPVAPSVSAPRQIVPTPAARTARVTATSAAPRSSDTPRRRPDPVLTLARALEALPESAWDEAMARASAPIGSAELAVAPIVVAPLVTPPIVDAPPAPPVQGEP